MKIAIIGKTKKIRAKFEKTFRSYGFKIDKKKPNLVLSVGGDGTFLYSEQVYPGISKLLIKPFLQLVNCTAW